MTNWPALPDCGVYLKWPQEGLDWIHPDDIESVQSLIPSHRVFRRTQFDGTYYRLEYGTQIVRVKPSLWLVVEDEHISIEDLVEVKSDLGVREPILAKVENIFFDPAVQRTTYQLSQRDLPLDRAYLKEELTLLTQHPSILQTPLEGANEYRELRIEPKTSNDEEGEGFSFAKS